MVVQAKRRLFSVDEYEHMGEVGILGEDDPVELIEGDVIDKSGPIGLYKFTTAEYERMIEAGILCEDDRVELIEGEIIEMSPMGRRHAACIARLITLFAPYAGKTIILNIQTPVRLSNYTEPEPDALVLRWRADHYEVGLPTPADVLLLVEVADTSLQYDQKDKLPIYARNGIHEVWVANLIEERVEVYTQPTSETYQEARIMKRGETFTTPALPGLTLTAEMILG